MSVLQLEVESGLARLTLNRPDAHNAFDFELKAALAEVLRELPGRDDVRAVLLTGAGKSFCSGGDISQWDPGAAPQVTRARWQKLLREVLVPLHRLEKPVVAAVQGHCHGLGLSLAMACDTVFVGEGATLSLAFTRLGLVPDFGSLFMLPRLVGMARAKDLVYTGRRFGAAEAVSYGLALEAVPADELLTRATAYAQTLADSATVALGLTKRILEVSHGSSLEQMCELEAHAEAVAITTADHIDAVAAFHRRETPTFAGR